MLSGQRLSMLVSIPNPVQATWFFIFFLITAIGFSLQKRKKTELFPTSLTQELKGFAILAIIFGHIGYFLATDHRFLFPLSIMSGVGVNLFLFLSGFGLTMSNILKKISIGSFYLRRLPKLYIPLWIVVGLFLLVDYFVLHRVYPLEFIRNTALGIFLHADIYNDFNSPLWYFTLILFYYLIFPIVFSKKYPWISAIGIYILSIVLIREHFASFDAVDHLYKIHLLSLPLGILCGWGYCSKQNQIKQYTIKKILLIQNFTQRTLPYVFSIIQFLNFKKAFFGILIFLTCYFAYYSGVGKSPRIEEAMSIVLLFLTLAIFMIKKYEIRLFSLFGAYSYEIYLLHWPILWRYDVLFTYTPGYVAVAIYLILFIGLGFILKKFSEIITHKVLHR